MYPTDSQGSEEGRIAAVQRHQTRYKAASTATRNAARLKRLAELNEKAERLGIRDGCPLGSTTASEEGQAVLPPPVSDTMMIMLFELDGLFGCISGTTIQIIRDGQREKLQ
ncbi:hypothetical protein Fcan01_27021 [Folsomia candida]|uniref:Uncharacterized protein n=1 Tax=Folsomia candida TaxID=158441 RepID=A0A226CXZ4_FOLCA|nr:hypothetical protein Fcan01_27021 [Folsomia candida]